MTDIIDTNQGDDEKHQHEDQKDGSGSKEVPSNNNETEEEGRNGGAAKNYTEEELDLFLREIMSRPIMFAIVVLSLVPYEYQRKFLEDSSKRIVVCAGRQVGKTFISGAKALFFALTNPNTESLIVSRTRRQSMHLFDMILNFIEYSPALKNCVVRKTRTMIKFSNRSVIHALPCGPNGDTIRSKTANLLIVDEANYVPESVITEVALPMLATTN